MRDLTAEHVKELKRINDYVEANDSLSHQHSHLGGQLAASAYRCAEGGALDDYPNFKALVIDLMLRQRRVLLATGTDDILNPSEETIRELDTFVDRGKVHNEEDGFDVGEWVRGML